MLPGRTVVAARVGNSEGALSFANSYGPARLRGYVRASPHPHPAAESHRAGPRPDPERSRERLRGNARSAEGLSHFHRQRLAPPLIVAPIENPRGDHVAVNLHRPTIDRRAPYTAIPLIDGRVGHIAIAAEELDGHVAHAHAGLGDEDFGHRD